MDPSFELCLFQPKLERNLFEHLNLFLIFISFRKQCSENSKNNRESRLIKKILIMSVKFAEFPEIYPNTQLNFNQQLQSISEF